MAIENKPEFEKPKAPDVWRKPHCGPPPEQELIPNATGEMIVVPLDKNGESNDSN